MGPVWGNMKCCSFLRDFESRVRFFYQQNLYWGIRETHKRRLWKRASLSIGAPLGNREGGGSFCGEFERQMKVGCGKGESLFVEAL